MPVTIESKEVGDKIEIVLYRDGREIRRETKDRVGNPTQPPAGDAIEDLLESYGVTKEWWKEYKAKHGLPPICGCDRRREYLNELSKAHPTLAKCGVMVFRALTRKPT